MELDNFIKMCLPVHYENMDLGILAYAILIVGRIPKDQILEILQSAVEGVILLLMILICNIFSELHLTHIKWLEDLFFKLSIVNLHFEFCLILRLSYPAQAA